MKDWSKQTVVQLKAELKRRGLGVAGLKQELVDRLAESDNEAASQNPEASPEPVLAESPKTEADEAAEAPAETTPIDTTPKDVPIAETGIKIAGVVENVPQATDEQTATEPDEQDTTATVPESIAAADPTPPAPAEIAQDAQKRKRRSESPVESSELVSRKRAKADQDRVDAANDNDAEGSDQSGIAAIVGQVTEGVKETLKESLEGGTSLVDDIAKDAMDISENITDAMDQDQPPTDADGENTAMVTDDGDIHDRANEGHAANAEAWEESRNIDHTPEPAHQSINRQDGDDDIVMDHERTVEAARHYATESLYIKNLMRPLKEDTVRAHLVELAAPIDAEPNNNDIDVFYLDQVKTHAFAIFSSVTKASRVRNALHGVRWPDESNRKELWVDFVPTDKIQLWIDEEQAQSRDRSIRFEVLYDEDGVARLVSGSAAQPARPAPEPTRLAPSGPAVKDVNNIPLGPRGGLGTQGAPSGPRGDAQRGPGPRPPRQIQGFPGGAVQTTRASPPISFQPVSDDLGARRIRNMRSHYTTEIGRDMGPETDINRYTFENGDKFVDRGKENFVGIRPPHREGDRRRQMAGGAPPPRGPPPSSRGGRRGGNGRRGNRMVSDRYLPGINEGGPYRQGDRGNFGPRPDNGRRFRSDDRDGWY
ncbi:SAP domain-containing protein [Colletotrichum higginsianum]|uniref:SAP domain-containing protein n=2 Tax=Colletotrichum higginsianum TaxID=80884 RepID=H1UWD5_COLHI|nr:SAP domain-containing protein [Colletotrichum higginsianum IMI 349063]OBR12383.1 SAP domain-containing protein [Colletotrichum higginsianum IMI 349063]TIC99111.1 Apoptotic chromatin condensation inducer in the nucleus [Colletotrichum higginsianum]GJC94068.1 SAP domain-containing protein [Colletotrichum higginsianum]CCF32286.1 SAP domain-containing protein [Colletotrichum higginsianum]